MISKVGWFIAGVIALLLYTFVIGKSEYCDVDVAGNPIKVTTYWDGMFATSERDWSC